MTNSVDMLRRLVQAQVVHFAHLSEQTFEMERDQFTRLAQELGLSTVPKNLTSVHVVDCIGRYEPINNTTIAEKLSLSKASITKISAKLLEDGYIKRSQLNDNRKEVFFSLAAKGKRVFELHEKLHEREKQRLLQLMGSFSETELSAILRFLQTLSDHYGGRAPE
ncbi:MarR family transcriptional regulator [Paenibacillus hodogayensis]|uniref:MarR family transcriptional regulator n=1 Tax=Paenibacillus hodogayensis TaxID=279208 RepID=A0ABV5W3V7_9BACL